MNQFSPSRIRPLLALLTCLALAGTATGQRPQGAWQPPDLPDAVASFGAVVHDGSIYVYGGHVGRVHAHSIENISPGFRRVALRAGQQWLELTQGQPTGGSTKSRTQLFAFVARLFELAAQRRALIHQERDHPNGEQHHDGQ